MTRSNSNPTQPPAPAWRSGRWQVAIAAAGVAFTLASFILAWRAEQSRLKLVFESAASAYLSTVSERVDRYEAVLFSLKPLFHFSKPANREEFAASARAVLKRQPDLLALEWLPRIDHATRTIMEGSMRAETGRNFQFKELDARGNLVPAGRREAYWPVLFAEPEEANTPRIGLDARAGPEFSLMLKAIDEAEIAAGPKATFQTGGRTLPSLEVFMPVYQRPEVPSSVEARRSEFAGFVRGVFHLENLMADAVKASELEGLEATLFDLDAAGEDQILFSNARRKGLPSSPKTGVSEGSEKEALSLSKRFPIGLRTWKIVLRASPEWVSARGSLFPLGVPLAAGALSAWVFAMVRASSKEKERIGKEVEERTRQLTQTNLRLEHQIQERLTAERGLLKTQYMLLASQRLGLMGSWERDLVQNTLIWSDEVYSIFGRSKDSFKPDMQSFFSVVHPDDLDTLRSVSEASLRTGKPFDIDYRILLPNGGVRHVVVHAEMIPGEGGSPVRMQGAIQDITDRKLNEAVLLETQAQLVAAQRLGHIGSWEADLKTLTMRWSDETYRICGYEPGQITPSLEGFRSLVHPEDLPRVKEQEDRSIRQGTYSSIEHRLVRADGAIRWVIGRSEVLRDSTGAAVRSIGTLQDVTELKEAELQRQTFERNLLEVQKLESLGLMAGGVAHDFNNLLAGILGSANLARVDLPRGHPAHQHLERVETASHRAAELCTQMLAYAGQGKIATRNLRLPALIRESAALMRASIGKHATLSFDLAPDTPLVSGDAAQLRRLVINLLLNASEAIGQRPGAIHISSGPARMSREQLARTHLAPNLPGGFYAWLTVRDDGEGMSSEILPKIFDPFFTTRFVGRGLGLAAALGIVRGHGGAIEAQSEPGRGSTFTLYLPAASVEGAVVSGPRETHAPSSSQPVPPLRESDPSAAPVRSRYMPRGERRG